MIVMILITAPSCCLQLLVGRLPSTGVHADYDADTLGERDLKDHSRKLHLDYKFSCLCSI